MKRPNSSPTRPLGPLPPLRPDITSRTGQSASAWVDPDAPIITRRAPASARNGNGYDRVRTYTDDSDLIAPASVDRRALDMVRSGQSFTRTFAVLALPRAIRPGLLASIMQLPGVHTAMVNNPLPRALAKDRLAALAHQMGVSLYHGSDEESADEALALRDIRRVLADVMEERSTVHLAGIYLTVAGADRAELDERCRMLRAACMDAAIAIVPCDAQHWDGMLTTAPLGHDHLRYLFETDTPTLARLLPSATAAMPPATGTPILYGVRAEGSGTGQVVGAPVLVDRFTLPSPHQAVIAATGSGKTYHQSLVLLQRFAHGNCDLCVLDPKDQEYRHLIEAAMGGTYLVLSPAADIQLNPLALPGNDPATIERLRRLDIDARARRASFVKQLIAGESLARGMPLSGGAEARLEEAIFACYERHGITDDPATFHHPPPTIREVAAYVTERNEDPALQAALELFTSGVLGRLFHGVRPLPLAIPRSSLRSDVGVLGIDLSAFVQGNDHTLQRVIPAVVADYCTTVALRGSGRRMELVIDEAWSVLHTAAGAQTIEVLARIGRSLGVAVTVITQQLREFLSRRVGDQMVPNPSGATFLDNCETILLLRQLRPARSAGGDDESHPILHAAKRLSLTPGEIQWLSRCGRDADGVTGLLILGREPIPLRIPRAPEPIHSLIVGADLWDGLA